MNSIVEEQQQQKIAYENIRFSSLFAAGHVSRGGTSATQRQKFYTDDVKSVSSHLQSQSELYHVS